VREKRLTAHVSVFPIPTALLVGESLHSLRAAQRGKAERKLFSAVLIAPMRLSDEREYGGIKVITRYAKSTWLSGR